MPSLQFWPTVIFIVFSLLYVLFSFLPTFYDEKEELKDEYGKPRTRVQIVVLGDIGRSPRMQYHAISIAKHGGIVDLVGYNESDLLPELLAQSTITIRPLTRTPKLLGAQNRVLFLLVGPLKVILQIFSLWMVLAKGTKPAKWILIQNPPSIPTLAIAQIISTLRRTRLIIDWHNFGHSILSLRLGTKHPLVRISRWYEETFCSTATAHFAVTDSMSRVLRNEYGIPKKLVMTLYDRPAAQYQPLSATQRLSFLSRLPETTARIEAIEKGTLRILVSSTSWTVDEDFSILLEALTEYSALATSTHPHLPEILAIITGIGPQQEHYLNAITTLETEGKLEMATIKTAWLTSEDYAALLASADLGVSLHVSSSGVDFPMKVIDMFGAGLPVVGWEKYEAWPERVQQGVNGMGFGNATELNALLVDLLGGNGDALATLKRGAIREGQKRWDDEWDGVAGRLLGFC